MLPTDEVNAIRAEVEEWLPQDVTLYAPTETSDGGGGISVSYTITWMGAGRLAPLSSMERAFSDAVKAVADAMVTLPASAPATERHRLVIGGATFEIVGVSTEHSIKLHTRVAVVRVR